jgi:hypothetical protein
MKANHAQKLNPRQSAEHTSICDLCRLLRFEIDKVGSRSEQFILS